MEGFIGSLAANVKVIAQATSGAIAGDSMAAKLYSQVTGNSPLPTISADGDNVAVLNVDIAGRTFQSVVWQGNGTNLNNREIVFTENSTGETFSINTKVLGAGITTLEGATATLAEPIKTLLSSTKFAQVRDLEIDTSGEEIIDDSGRVIGNVEGMTVSLNSTDFSNKQFEDFTIIPDPSILGNILFIATINGQEFICKIRATELNEGKALTFNASNGDTLTINIGKSGINSLSDPKNYKIIASAMKKSLMKIGGGIDVRTGFDSDNVTKLVIADLSTTKLYRNNQNKYVPKLDLLTKESVRVAQEVITNALNLVYSARAKLQGQGNNLDRCANVLNSTIGVTKDASGSYLDTDLVEAASAFAAALKSILAAVSTLQAGAKVADAGLEIIKSAAT
jgi:flagellin-like hook-associated protein FlgL